MPTSFPSASTALITGASHGIGLALARELAAHGHPLILTARSTEQLEQVATDLSSRHGIVVTVIPLDLTDPGAPSRLIKEIAARNLTVDILVNNAGFGLKGPFAHTALARELEMIHLNIAALTTLTKLALPHMLSRRAGRILNLASTAAFQPGPLMAVYYASKAYVLHFSEAIAEELRDTGVTVTALCPGPTRTRFATDAGMRTARMEKSPFMMDVDDVARFGYRAMMRGQRVAIPGFLNQCVAFGTRFVPRRVAATLARLSQEHR